MEGNSPPSTSTESHASTMLPDQEDINGDNTLNEQENFYEYKIDISQAALVKGNGYIVDVIHATSTNGPDSSKNVNWYQFKIPITSGKTVWSISDFKSIRFLRMYLYGFHEKNKYTVW